SSDVCSSDLVTAGLVDLLDCQRKVPRVVPRRDRERRLRGNVPGPLCSNRCGAQREPGELIAPCRIGRRLTRADTDSRALEDGGRRSTADDTGEVAGRVAAAVRLGIAAGTGRIAAATGQQEESDDCRGGEETKRNRSHVREQSSWERNWRNHG